MISFKIQNNYIKSNFVATETYESISILFRSRATGQAGKNLIATNKIAFKILK